MYMCQNRKNASVLFDNMVLCPNSFMTITPKEYTKHYYMNGERLASSIGGGGLCAIRGIKKSWLCAKI